MWKKIGFVLLIAGILIFSVEALLAQPPMDPKKMRERIETLRLWKMIEVLDLTPEQSDKFLPLLHRFQQKQRELETFGKQLLRDLEEELNSTEPSEKKIQNILLDLEKNRKSQENERDNFLTSSRQILSTIQEAKLIWFEHNFEKELRDTIRKFWMEPGRHFKEG
jgi:Spy/CpxP family protein refolding chaperone